MSNESISFKQGYDVLKKNAELLESQQEPDIDNLMKIVEESIKVKKYYQKTLFLNLNLSCNDFINILRKTIGKDFLIARDADNAFHCLFEDNTILLYSKMSKRPEYNYYMLGVEAYIH